MRKPLTIAVDFDGVLADTSRVKAHLVERHLGRLIAPGELNRTSALSSLTPGEYELVSRTACDPAHTARTEPVDGSLRGIAQLRERFGVVILTRRQGEHLGAAESWVGTHAETVGLPVVGIKNEDSKQDWCRREGAAALADDDLAQVSGFGPGEAAGVLFAPEHPSSWINWGVRVARSWGELIGMFESLRLPRAAPTSATIELGRRCNLNCLHCFSDSGPGGENGPDTARVRRTLDALAELGVRAVWFSGGEPTLREDLLGLIAYAAGLSLDVYVSTNGIMSEARATGLSVAPVRRIDVSLDGVSEDHDALRGRGNFARTVEGLERLTSRNAPVALSVHLRREMKRGAAQFAEELLRLRAPVRFAPLLPFGRASRLRHLCPTFAEFEGWLEELRKFMPGGAPLVGSDRCWAGATTIAFDSSGSPTPCCFQRGLRLAAEDDRSLADLWENSEVLDAIRKEPPAGCTRCDIAARFHQPQRTP